MEETKLPNSTINPRIIEAAKKLFIENGIKGTTTKMIAKEAQIHEATLFRHFKTKESIFVEVSKDITQHGHSRLETIVNSDLSPEEMLFQFGMELHKLISESKGILLVAIIESKSRIDLAKNVTITLRTIIDVLEKKLIDLYNKGLFKNNDFFTASLIYVESLIGLFIVQNRLAGEMIPIQIERLCRSSSQILLKGLLKD